MTSTALSTENTVLTARTIITFFAFFDVGDQAGSIADTRLRELSHAQSSSILYTYDVATGVMNSRPSGTNGHNDSFPNILQIYRDEMYGRRIAAFARTLRFGQMYQLEPIPLSGLSKNQQSLIPATSTVTCHPIISVTNLGVACIQLWVHLPDRLSVNQVIPFGDPSQLLASSVDYTLNFGKETWTLQRKYISVLDVMAFLATQLLCELGIIEMEASIRHSPSASWQDVLRKAKRARDERTVDLPSIEYIETYPLYHLDYRGNTPPVNCDELKALLNNNAHVFRALMTKDINWRLKKTEIVRETLNKASCTTRDSILWFVASQGAVKVYCDALETDYYVSMVLAAFEIELLLGMRYFLEKINYSLNAVSFEATSPGLLARIHRQNIERLDSFFSLATCTKDTTSNRLERLKAAFGIHQLSNTTAEKIRALSDLVSAHYNERLQENNERLQKDNERLQRAQTLLTILFGIFGIGQLTSAFFFWYFVPQQPPALYLLSALLLTLSVMLLVGAGIYRLGLKKDSNNTRAAIESQRVQVAQLEEKNDDKSSITRPQWSHRGRKQVSPD
jgi:hypothetical protein